MLELTHDALKGLGIGEGLAFQECHCLFGCDGDRCHATVDKRAIFDHVVFGETHPQRCVDNGDIIVLPLRLFVCTHVLSFLEYRNANARDHRVWGQCRHTVCFEELAHWDLNGLLQTLCNQSSIGCHENGVQV